MKSYAIRLLRILIGFPLFAAGVVCNINANIGYGPWEVFHVGITLHTGLSLGTVSILVGLVLVLITIQQGEKFGLGSILNMLLIGLLIDFYRSTALIPIAQGMVQGIVMLIGGLFLIALGSFFYISAGFGAGPRDSLMVLLARKTRLSAGLCRSLLEMTVTFVGWLLGGMVGIGSIISVLCIGICVQIVFRLLRFDPTSVHHDTLQETWQGLQK